MIMLKLKLVSSLTKVFADQEPTEELLPISVLKGETASFQVAIFGTRGKVAVEAEAAGFRVRVREVCQMPVYMPCWPDNPDTGLLRNTPGLYPDWLKDLPEEKTVRLSGWWHSLWIDAEPEDDLPGGDYSVVVRVTEEESGEACSVAHDVHVVDCKLPKQTLTHTEWFHSDCLADYYRVEVFSAEYWRILENFMRSAVRMGINMILTPIFTPPLDTWVGGERTTVQLIQVTCENGQYSFNFDLLKRWIDLATECGIEYFEIAHLYTQWGAKHAPKIMATVDGEYKRIFGWETEALGEDYRNFLACMLPQLAEKLHEWNVADRCRFHISDEPHGEQFPDYAAAKAQTAPYLPGFRFMDAMSEYRYYEMGAVDQPIISSSSDQLHLFFENNVPDMWVYYCCGQKAGCSNRFIAMPSARNRILGTQLYLCGIVGFLQWGFNFYNNTLSQMKIDPYATADGYASWPAGDPFMVYPNPNGTADESIRYMVFRQGLCDLRALQLLESLAGKEATRKIVFEGLEQEFDLGSYPEGNEYLPNMRARVNREIERLTKAE